MEAGRSSRKKVLGLFVAGAIAVTVITGVSSAGAVTNFTNVPKCPGIPGCRHSLDQRAGWEGWVLNNPSHCAARVMKPYLDSNKQVVAWTEVFCQHDQKLTVRSRLFANYQFADLNVDQKGCINKASCVRNVPRGFSYYRLACPKSGEACRTGCITRTSSSTRANRSTPPAAVKALGSKGTTRSRDAKLSPYCAF